ALNAYSLDNGRWIENAKMENTIGNSKVMNQLFDIQKMNDAANLAQEHNQKYRTHDYNQYLKSESWPVDRLAPWTNYMQGHRASSMTENRVNNRIPSNKNDFYSHMGASVAGSAIKQGIRAFARNAWGGGGNNNNNNNQYNPYFQ